MNATIMQEVGQQIDVMKAAINKTPQEAKVSVDAWTYKALSGEAALRAEIADEAQRLSHAMFTDALLDDELKPQGSRLMWHLALLLRSWDIYAELGYSPAGPKS